MRARAYDRALLLERTGHSCRALERLGVIERLHAQPPRTLDAEQPLELESGLFDFRFKFFGKMEVGSRKESVLRNVPAVDEGSFGPVPHPLVEYAAEEGVEKRPEAGDRSRGHQTATT